MGAWYTTLPPTIVSNTCVSPIESGSRGSNGVRYTLVYTVDTLGDSMRTNVVLDDDLLKEAFALTGARTKKDVIHQALRELVRVRRRKNLMDLAGRLRFRDGFDHKKLRETRRGSR